LRLRITCKGGRAPFVFRKDTGEGWFKKELQIRLVRTFLLAVHLIKINIEIYSSWKMLNFGPKLKRSWCGSLYFLAFTAGSYKFCWRFYFWNILIKWLCFFLKGGFWCLLWIVSWSQPEMWCYLKLSHIKKVWCQTCQESL
jgi:hypothetical protein